VLALFLLAIIAFEMWGPIHRGEGYFHILFGVTVLGLGVVVVLQIVGYVLTATMPNGKQAFFLLLLTGFATISFGQWLGYSVQESARGQEIILKDKTLSDAKLVLVMSRHTILLKDNSTLVVPTADIAQFKSALPLP
jgi:hypothetical protein